MGLERDQTCNHRYLKVAYGFHKFLEHAHIIDSLSLDKVSSAPGFFFKLYELQGFFRIYP